MNPPALAEDASLVILGISIEAPIASYDLLTLGAYESYVTSLHHPFVVLSLHSLRTDRRE